MKTRDFLWGLLACAAFSACSSDEVVDNTKEFKDKAYMKVQVALSGDLTSRGTGGSYVNGSADEQYLTDVNFFFYDVNGNYMTKGIAVANQTPTVITGNTHDEAESSIVISLTLNEGDDFPAQVIAIANKGDVDVADFENKTLSQIKDMTNVPASFATAKTFTMTNSTYLDASNGIVIGTPVDNEDFHATEELALAATTPVTIHIERLAAKVSVKIAESMTNDGVEDANGNTLKFEVKGFKLNGTNQNSYWLKKVQTEWTNTWSTSWTDWNITSDYRCFWAEDVNYDMGTYPTNLSFTKADPETESYSLNAQYCLENTFDLSKLGTTNNNLFRHSTHVLVFGQYTIDYAEENKANSTVNEDIFMYVGSAYTTTDLLNHWLNNSTSANIWVKNTESYETAGSSCYEIVPVEGSVDKVTMQLKKGTYYSKDANGEFTSFTDISTINTTLKTLLVATGYKNGYGYFPVLIEHFGPEGSDGYDTTAELGVVRNHVYEISITSITNLAEGVFNPEVEIIPDSSVKTYYLGTKLKILSWKNVSQDVEL